MRTAPASWLPDPRTQPEALIKEARRRQRRRWLAAGVAVAAVLASAAGVVTGLHGPGSGHPSRPGLRSQPVPPAAARHTARAPAPVPLAGSFLMDLTWVGDQRGWALAAAPCSRGLCPRVAATRDGGRTWTALPVPPGLSISEGSEVSQIRFVSTRVGYLFGPALYQTEDGGRTWRRVPSRPVEALEPSAGTVIRVVYDHGGCPGPCTRTVQETTAGSAAWHTLLHIPWPSAYGGVDGRVVRQGTSVIYLPLYGNLARGYAPAVIFRSTDSGTSWRRLTDPCGRIGQARYDAAGLAAAQRGFLAVGCLPVNGTGFAFVRTSTDYGSSWSPPRPVPGGTRYSLSLIAAASPGRLVVATGAVGGSGPFPYRLAVSADGGVSWSTAITGTMQINPQAPGTTFLGFEDARVGRWISDAQHIWTTRDGGLHWLRQAFR
ncbi:MAG TPA: hypothetical protein VH307_26635 [Streptosporangiaceae bacterium]|nr:hypothetical protein [Streptosporangiaceae bacterium]